MDGLTVTMDCLNLSQKDVDNCIKKFLSDLSLQTAFWSKFRKGGYVEVMESGKQIIIRTKTKSGTILSEKSIQQLIDGGNSQFIVANKDFLNV